MAVSSRIFISYRREDASPYAGRLNDALSARFPGQVFMDVDALEPGIDFVERIEDSVSSVDVLIAVIGRGWVGAVDRDGRRRLDQPDDFVRLEVAAALRRNIRVIPVLVGGATFPEPEELPEDLAGLRRRSGLVLSDLEWRAGTERLIEAVQHVLGMADAPSEDAALQQVVEETQRPPEGRSRPAVESEQALPVFVLPFALGGAVLLAVGLFVRWHGKDAVQSHSFVQNDFGGHLQHGGAFTSLAPIGIVVAAALGALLARKPSMRAVGAGVLIGAGVAGAVKYLRVFSAADSPTRSATIGLLAAIAGGVLVFAAGLIASRATHRIESPPCAAGAMAAIAGAVVMVIATVIPYNGGGDEEARKVARSLNEAFDPVATSLAIAIIALLLLRPWRHAELSAALLTLGCLDALLWVRYLAVPVLEDSSVGSFGPGGVVGLLGAGLVLFGGSLGLKGSKAYGSTPLPVQP